MRVCDRCLNSIDGNDKYCNKCGNYVGLKFCTKCGSPLNENERFCSVCGVAQPAPQPVPQQNSIKPLLNTAYQNTPFVQPPLKYPQKTKNELSHFVPLLLWSIILILALNPIGMGFGIASIFYLFKARSFDQINYKNEEERKENIHERILKSRILCITATIIDIIALIVFLAILYSKPIQF